MADKQFSYNKNEKLKSRKALKQLFTTGKSFLIYPVKVFFMEAPDQNTIIKAGVGVSKKNFKKATDRNRIKRLLRESYRTEKYLLEENLKQKNKPLCIFLLYINKELPDYTMLKSKVNRAILKLVNYVEAAA